MWDDLGSPPLLHKRPFHQIRGTNILLMAPGDGKMVQTRVRAIEQTATGFRKLALIPLHDAARRSSACLRVGVSRISATNPLNL
jgi:hypothetical protein